LSAVFGVMLLLSRSFGVREGNSECTPVTSKTDPSVFFAFSISNSFQEQTELSGQVSPISSHKGALRSDFHAERPNAKWLTDITEFHLPAGKVSLSPIIDCYDGMVVSWTIGASPDADLVNSILDRPWQPSRLENGRSCIPTGEPITAGLDG